MSKTWEQPLIKVILGGAVISIALLPFVISEVTFFPGNFARAILFRIIVEIMLVAYIGLLLINTSTSSDKTQNKPLSARKKYLPPINPLTLLVGGWWLVIGLATIFAAHPILSFWGGIEQMEGFLTMSHYFLFFFILAGTLREQKQWLIILNAGILGSAVMSSVAILQHFSLAFTHPILVGKMIPRASGTLESPLFLSAYLLFFIFLALTLLSQNIKKRFAPLYAGALILQVTALFFTDTRGGQFAFILGIIWFVILLPSKHRLIKMGKIIVATSSIMLLAALVFLILNNEVSYALEGLPFMPRILYSITDMNIFASYLDQRLDVLEIAWNGAKERPILGYGPESFTLVMDRFFTPSLNLFYREQWLNKPLNIVFDTLIVSGILGLLVYFAIFLQLFWKFVLKNKNNVLSHGLFVVLLVYFVQNLVNLDSVSAYIPFFFVLSFSGFLIGGKTLAGIVPAKLGLSRLRILSFPENAKPWILFTALLVVLVSILFLNIQPLLANRDIQKITEIAKNNPDSLRAATNYLKEHHTSLLRNANVISYDNSLAQLLVLLDSITTVSAIEYPEETKEVLEMAIELIEKEQKLKSGFSKPYFLLARFYTKLSQFDKAAVAKAQENFEKATALSPNRYMFWIEWAKSDPLLGAPTNAIEHGKRAISLLPSLDIAPEAYFWTGIGYIYSGDVEKAQLYVNKFKTPGAYQYLERTYKITRNYDFLLNTFYPERIKEEPENLQWRASLAVTHYELGNRIEACGVVKDLLKEPDISPESRASAEEFLQQLGC